MRIVLPGALPDSRTASGLISHLETAAPTLLAWFRQSKAAILQASPAATGCTPHEYWQLLEAGFKPQPGQRPAAGLAPLRLPSAGNDSNDPVWAVELVHLSPSRDGAALLPASELDIAEAHSVALFESVHDFFAEAGFGLERATPAIWRIRPPEGCTVAAASPALVSLTSVNDWWPQDDATRPWRRLVNEVQMLWFDHAVNRERFERQQVPVNSLWLYGGAAPAQLAKGGTLPPAVEPALAASLADAANRQDWGRWLQVLQALEHDTFAPQGQATPEQLVLTGGDRIVTLEPARRSWLGKWLKRQDNNWRHWWSPQD